MSQCEHLVLVGISMGYTNKEIALARYVTEDTVKMQVRTLLDRLGARDRSHAVAIGFRMGLLG